MSRSAPGPTGVVHTPGKLRPAKASRQPRHVNVFPSAQPVVDSHHSGPLSTRYAVRDTYDVDLSPEESPEPTAFLKSKMHVVLPLRRSQQHAFERLDTPTLGEEISPNKAGQLPKTGSVTQVNSAREYGPVASDTASKVRLPPGKRKGATPVMQKKADPSRDSGSGRGETIFVHHEPDAGEASTEGNRSNMLTASAHGMRKLQNIIAVSDLPVAPAPTTSKRPRGRPRKIQPPKENSAGDHLSSAPEQNFPRANGVVQPATRSPKPSNDAKSWILEPLHHDDEDPGESGEQHGHVDNKAGSGLGTQIELQSKKHSRSPSTLENESKRVRRDEILEDDEDLAEDSGAGSEQNKDLGDGDEPQGLNSAEAPVGRYADTEGSQLFGQMEILLQARNVLRKAGFKNTRSTKHDRVGQLKSLCAKMTQDLRHLYNAPEEEAQAFASVDTIEAIISGLCKEPPKHKQYTDKKLIKGVYHNIIPALVSLVIGSIRCFEALDAGESSQPGMTTGHLRILLRLLQLAVRMGETLYSSYINKAQALGDGTTPFINTVHREAVMPLRKVRNKLQSQIASLEAAERQHEAHARATAAAAAAAARSSSDYQLDRGVRALRKEWQALHAARRQVEGIISTKQQQHLGLPYEMDGYRDDGDVDSGRETEGGADGDSTAVDDDEEDGEGNVDHFDGETRMFVRVGPPLALIRQACACVWSVAEMTALHDGLRDCAGPAVFQRIFSLHCRRGGVLNRYNVTEIVTTAAWLKALLKREQRLAGGEVEAWVSDIPDWTKPHAINTDAEQEEDDDVDENDGEDEEEDEREGE